MKKALHLAYVCADRGVPVGGRKGASAHVWELTRALTRCGVEVRIIAARVDDQLDARRLPAPVTDLGVDRVMRQLRALSFNGTGTERQRVRAAETYGLLLNQGMARELERLHRRWRVDAVYERYSLWSFAGAAFARGARVPYLLEVNAPLRVEQQRYRGLENVAAAAGLEAVLLASADHVILPAAALRAYVVGRGARAGGVRVIPNAADPALFAPRPATHARARDTFVVGFLGSLKPWHGVEQLLSAFRRLHRRDRSYRLLIAGDGPLRPRLQRLLRQHRLADAARFTGELAHDDVPAVLADMDVAVAPYPRLSGFYFSPLKVFEYMAAGVPVVASDIGQLSEILRHRTTALLYRPGSVTELTAALARLRREPALAARLAHNARRLVVRRFTWQRNAERLVRLIEHGRARAGRDHGSR